MIQRLLQTYAKEVKAVFGERLESLLVYGSAVRNENFCPGDPLICSTSKSDI